jgi:hypothetical protein
MKHFFLSVMILSVIIGITACKKDKSTYPSEDTEFPSELRQTWKAVSVDGKAIITDATMVLQIKDRERADLMERMVYDSIPVWQTMHSVISYSNDTLKIIGSIDKPFKRVVLTYKILELTTDRLKMKLISEYENNHLKPDRVGQESVFESFPSNVDAKIYVMLKAESAVPQTFGLYFKTTGDYDYYYYDGGASSIKGDNEGFYWFYGNFMVLRYKNTHDTHDQQEYVACWNVKIVETTDETNPKTMTFTALREGGITETVLFRFIGTF